MVYIYPDNIFTFCVLHHVIVCLHLNAKNSLKMLLIVLADINIEQILRENTLVKKEIMRYKYINITIKILFFGNNLRTGC